MASLLSRVTEGGRARRTAYSQINLINDTIPSKLLWNSFVTGFLVSDESDQNPLAARHYLMSFFDFDYATMYNPNVLSSTEDVDFYDIAFILSQSDGVTEYHYTMPQMSHASTKVSDSDASKKTGYSMQTNETLNVDESTTQDAMLTASASAVIDIQSPSVQQSFSNVNNAPGFESVYETGFDYFYPQNGGSTDSSSIYIPPTNREIPSCGTAFGVGLVEPSKVQEMTEGWVAYYDAVLCDAGQTVSLSGLPDTNVVCELVRYEPIFEPIHYKDTDNGNSGMDSAFGTGSKWCIDDVEIQWHGFSGHLHETPTSTKGLLSSVTIFVDNEDPGSLEPDDPDIPTPEDPDPGEDPDVVLISAAGISDIDFVVNPNSYYTIHVEVPDEISIVSVSGLDSTMSWNALNQQLTGWVLGQTVKEVVFTLSNSDTATLRISATATPAHVI